MNYVAVNPIDVLPALMERIVYTEVICDEPTGPLVTRMIDEDGEPLIIVQDSSGSCVIIAQKGPFLETV